MKLDYLLNSLPDDFTAEDLVGELKKYKDRRAQLQANEKRIHFLQTEFFKTIKGCEGGCLCKKTELPKYRRFQKAIKEVIDDIPALLDVIDKFGLTHIQLSDLDA